MSEESISSKIIGTKIQISLLKDSNDIQKYYELSQKFDCIRYMYLIEQYISGNQDVRNLIKDDIKDLELNNSYVIEYIDLFKKDTVKKYLSLQEELIYLKMQQEQVKRMK